eukprot:1144174-Pelagomonas_calceolata.AAC.6
MAQACIGAGTRSSLQACSQFPPLNARIYYRTWLIAHCPHHSLLACTYFALLIACLHSPPIAHCTY